MAEKSSEDQKNMEIDGEEEESKAEKGIAKLFQEMLSFESKNPPYLGDSLTDRGNALLVSFLMTQLSEDEKRSSSDEGLGLDVISNFDTEYSEPAADSEYLSSDTEDEQLTVLLCPKRRKLDRRSKDAAMKTITGKRTFEEYDSSEESDDDPSYVPQPFTCSDNSTSESSSLDESEEDSPMKAVQE